MTLNNRKIYIIILVFASIATHFAYFGQPAETVFDEVHFGKFISGYFTGEYFFDIHPPLGKLMLSGTGYLAGFEPGFGFENIGQKYADSLYEWLRLAPTVAGILLPIVIFLLALELRFSNFAAFGAGALVALENSLLVQSRFILLDSFLLLFGFLSLLFYFKYKNRRSTSDARYQIFLILAGFFGALAASVKWTGATFLTIVCILYLIDWIKNDRKTRTAVGGIAWLILTPIVIYFGTFALHFKLLDKSGPGDAFMTPGFRKTLTDSADYNNPDIRPSNILEKFKELNLQMYKSNATLTATHPYSSQWYTWPFMARPIYYWNGSTKPAAGDSAGSPQTQSRIYLLGNPIIWWASTIAIIYLIIGLAQQIWQKIVKRNVTLGYIPVLLGGAYILNLLPFVGIRRAMFLYHYFPTLIFSIIALVYLIDKLPKRKTAFAVLLALSVIAFVFFAPLTYGLPLSESGYNWRVWLGSWL
ncbi:MAG: phospholipid carrier-dependent glycosyltransferase [Candidatus Yanofskybacteria bacterium]|nr:phospholipid carrier-dependent glycosyltransferase [Candidatus Yanofskybacteria bacterium]